jgi:hypothetical protein
MKRARQLSKAVQRRRDLECAGLPTSPEFTTATFAVVNSGEVAVVNSGEVGTATFADDTAVVATDSDPGIGSYKLQTNLLAIQNWFKNWRMKANGCKPVHVTFIIFFLLFFI